MTDKDRLAAEQRARVLIDRQLTDAGWVVQDKKALNLFADQGVAVREVIMAKGHGRADYLLYVDQLAVGVIEAKPEGTPLSGVEWQSAMYAEGLPAKVRLKAVTTDGRLPFVFEASGSETHFTNGYDPNPRARRVFAFPQPSTLARTLRDATADPERPTWRGKVAAMPELDIKMLRPAQITAIGGIERSLAEQHFDRSLVQMATGAGKTFAAVTTAYRLLKHGGFNRVLFLVDRNNLADQTLAEFQNYRTPDDGRRFTEIYNVDKLTGAGMLGSSKVVVSTPRWPKRAGLRLPQPWQRRAAMTSAPAPRSSGSETDRRWPSAPSAGRPGPTARWSHPAGPVDQRRSSRVPSAVSNTAEISRGDVPCFVPPRASIRGVRGGGTHVCAGQRTFPNSSKIL
jgi:type I restriction enzyme, R subunit